MDEARGTQGELAKALKACAPWLLLLMAVLLGGCGPTPDAGGGSGAGPAASPVDPVVVKAVLDWFVAQKHLNWRTGHDPAKQLDEHRGFFVVRRAWWLLAHGPAAWASESGHTTLIGRIDSEFTALEAYANAKLGTPAHPGPLTGGSGDVNPPHLDLADVARRRPGDPSTTMAAAVGSRGNAVQRRAGTFITERRARALTIVWRGAGIHDDLWEPAADLHTATLRAAAMDEILDRRLHAVERMNYQISRSDVMGAHRLDMSAGPHGPWRDGLRIRMFEYPRLHTAVAVPAVGPVAEWDDYQQPGPDWRYESTSHRRIVYNVPPGHRFRNDASPGFPLTTGSSYWHTVWPAAGLTPAQAMDKLYTPSEDWWDRSWVYCDHVVSSLHLVALLLAKRRRPGAGEAWFDNLVTSNPRGYVQLGPVLYNSVGAQGTRLMDSPSDPTFHNELTPLSDLELGDHVIFWNSILYPVVSNGEWQLENALVVGIRSDPEHGLPPAGTTPTTSSMGSLRLDKVLLQGHGTNEKTTGDYVQEIGGYLREGMVYARTVAGAAAAGTNALRFNGVDARLVRWSPYPDTWTAPGAWWVRVLPRRQGETLQKVRDILRKGVLPDPAYPNPAPFNDSVYFPLWEPAYPGGWEHYLADRANGAVHVSRRLREVPVDGTIIPGLHFEGGTWDPLPVVRPRVTV